MNVTINPNLTSVVTIKDGTLECRLPNYNPETLVPFASEADVRSYANAISTKPNFFTPKVDQVVSVKVTPPEFKLLFTAAERVAIKASTDPVVQDFFSIIEDPRLTYVDLGLQSTKDALEYLRTKNLITKTRKDDILTGVVR